MIIVLHWCWMLVTFLVIFC